MFLSATGIQSSNIVKELVSLHLSALFECNNFSDFSFVCGWGVFRARGTFGVLAENSVVL